MNLNQSGFPIMKKAVFRYIYVIILFFTAITGFGQMPIFKRYYIADIPGLGWLAEFYTTHYIHYLCAVMILGILSYILIEYLMIYKRDYKLMISGYIRGILLTAIIITGILLVIRNLTGYWFSPGEIIFLDFAHLGLVLIFLMIALYALIFKKKYCTPVNG